MQKFKVRQFFLLFSLLIFLFSCKNEEIKLLKVRDVSVYDCKIVSSSQSQIYKLLDTNTWNSSTIAKDDVILFSFYKSVYISKISVNQIVSGGFDKIISVSVYSQNGKIGVFSENEIEINQNIDFLLLKIDKTTDFLLTDAYLDDKKYSIAFDDLNKSCAIKQVQFWQNDSTPLKINVEKSVFVSQSTPNFIPQHKILDYSNSEKSITFKASGEVVGFSKSASADTFYFGNLVSFKNWKNSANYKIDKFIFNDVGFEKQMVSLSLKKDVNVLKINGLSDFRMDFDDDFFVDIATFDTNIVEDIRYATANNFTGKVIYDCPFCLFRYFAAQDLKKASQEFQRMGYRIKVFDCYRPHPAQYKLWEIVPNINYVANPDKGSIHNRGAAVDLTLVDSTGKQLNMGTTFDYFGYPAYSINMDLPDSILQNRNTLWTVMENHGFKRIKTEWWHMSHYSCLRYPISEMDFPCSDE